MNYINLSKNVLKRKKSYFLLFLFIFYVYYLIIINNNTKYQQDDLTIVSAYYRIKSKHLPEEYLKWIKNFVMLNKSIVFFTNKEFMPTFKKLRPKELHHKTVFIVKEIEDFYSYKNFYKEFNKSFEIDIENSYQTVPLYLVWSEKLMFLKKAISENYFNSKCFYWIDAGHFREDIKDIQKYLNNWPSLNKCYQDKRILMAQVKYFSEEEKKKIINFDNEAHIKLQKDINVAANLFGGQVENCLKFINYYYESLLLFIKKKIFIGKEQNIYTYIAFSHPEIFNLVLYNNNYTLLRIYLS